MSVSVQAVSNLSQALCNQALSHKQRGELFMKRALLHEAMEALQDGADDYEQACKLGIQQVCRLKLSFNVTPLTQGACAASVCIGYPAGTY